MLVTQIKVRNKSKPIHVKCPPEIVQLLQDKADKYAEGNLSEWLRYAGLNFVPNKDDLVEAKKKPKKK